MNHQSDFNPSTRHELQVFQPSPNIFYSLDATAHLAGVPRRSILIYSRAGLLRPIFQPPYGIMTFTEEAIYLVRRIEDVRAIHGHNVASIKTLFALLAELESLRAEVRFLRTR